jgi:hypothetical protein
VCFLKFLCFMKIVNILSGFDVRESIRVNFSSDFLLSSFLRDNWFSLFG